jgi:hypothetical protein
MSSVIVFLFIISTSLRNAVGTRQAQTNASAARAHAPPVVEEARELGVHGLERLAVLGWQHAERTSGRARGPALCMRAAVHTLFVGVACVHTGMRTRNNAGNAHRRAPAC